MSSKSIIVITSAIAKDAELRYTPSGAALCSFSVPADSGWGDKKKTIWYRCTLYGERAEKLSKHLVKGFGVMVIGELQADDNGGPRIWTDKDGNARANFEVTVDEITLLGMRAPRQDAPTDEADTDPIPF